MISLTPPPSSSSLSSLSTLSSVKMSELLRYHIPETIEIRVTRRDSVCHDGMHHQFYVDPQVTSLTILQALLVRAFQLDCDFFLYYLDRATGSTSKRLPLTSEADLEEAYLYSAHPHLEISLDVVDFSPLATSDLEDSNDSTNTSRLARFTQLTANVLAEWDVVTSSDVILAQTLSKTNNFIFKQIEKLKNKARSLQQSSSNGTTSWYLAETIFQYIQSEPDRKMDPLDDISLRGFLDAEGRIKSQRDLRIEVYRRGVDSSLRRVIWKHLLNVYPCGMSGQERIDWVKSRCDIYRQMKTRWQAQATTDPEVITLCNMVRKDVRRTDRHHPFYENTAKSTDHDPDADDNLNVTSLFNLLITYALNHRVRYCQGMGDLASPILYVMKDEAHAYITFCALMSRLGENFSTDGQAISRKFAKLTSLLQHYDPEFYQYLRSHQAHELLFCYRWMLLDLKREFQFDEALEMLEVLWASIPPESDSNSKLKLFEQDYVYTPNRHFKEEDNHHLNSIEIQKEVKERLPVKVEMVEAKPKRTTPANQRIRSIKFLPNVLSTDSQVLDSPSPTEAECIDPNNNNNNNRIEGPKLWDSPNPTNARRRFDFEPTKVGSSQFYLGQFFSYEADEGEEVAESSSSESPKMGIMHQKQQSDDLSSCSTFDSGIQRSNTITSIYQDEASRTESDSSTRRRHCLDRLRHAHCNGDDLSDSEELDVDAEDGCCDSSVDGDHGYHTDSKQHNKNDSSSFVSTSSITPTPSKSSKFSPLAKAKQLLGIGRSVSVDSIKDERVIMHAPEVTLQDSINEAFNILSAKSVSEEMLNEAIEEMSRLVPGSPALNTSSASSSLEILPQDNQLHFCSSPEPEAPLLTPEELGSSDAFMLFLCLTMLLQNRDHIMEQGMDRNDVQMYFDAMVRKHPLRAVLNDARNLFHTYLSQWDRVE